MPHTIVMPQLGLTMTHGTIARWIKREGDSVREGEPLLEVSTDKINYEVESPASGTLAWTSGNEGDEFACGATIGEIALAAEPLASAPLASAPLASAPLAAAAAASAAPPARAPQPARSNGERIVASPAARKLARERGVPLGGLRGSGPHGRITLSDVLASRPDEGFTAFAAIARAAQAERPAAGAQISLPPQLPPQRRAIYRKMTEVAAIPLAQVETRARVDALHALLKRRGDAGWAAYSVFAVARLLAGRPEIRIDARTGAPFSSIDIGVATDAPNGLVVPVVRGAAALTLAQTHREIVRLAEAARGAKLFESDIGSACFTISNVGPQGVERVVPLVDPPQTAILGMGAATQQAVVDGTTLAAGRVVSLVLTFDHRFIDGAPAARFLAELAQAFAEPGMLL